MKSRKKFLIYLLLFLLTIIGLMLFANTFNPSEYVELGSFNVNPIVPFLILIFLAVSSLFSFILANIRRGLLIALFGVTFLSLQYFHINSVIYTLLLLAICILLELLFWKKQ